MYIRGQIQGLWKKKIPILPEAFSLLQGKVGLRDRITISQCFFFQLELVKIAQTPTPSSVILIENQVLTFLGLNENENKKKNMVKP